MTNIDKMTKIDKQTNTNTNKSYKHAKMIKTKIQENDKDRQEIQRQALTKMTITNKSSPPHNQMQEK